ncbi:unnamed protein product [Cylindrotheca closterium]|uniref:Helicase-associated domain-containing protein n=1 Tax=Cylindrotheca closterium TaxID=2856 RepID=A0AAD2FVE7_9STRA|nr:unnamed protein product [Cylindrotheca closterium]
MVFSVKQEKRINELVEFQKEHGHCHVPCKTALGNWLSHQRREYKKWKTGEKASCITQELVTKLERIGFEWGGRRERNWKLRIQELIQFKREHGHCNVPQYYSENKTLGFWVHKQRSEYTLWKKGTTSCWMTQERVGELENLGFVWDAQKAAWKTLIQELVAFKELHGHCKVPQKFPSNQLLSTWARNTRNHYKKYQKGNESRLTKERFLELKSLGFDGASIDSDGDDDEEMSSNDLVCETRKTPRMTSGTTKKGGSKAPRYNTGGFGQVRGGHETDERQEAASGSSKKRKTMDQTNATKVAKNKGTAVLGNPFKLLEGLTRKELLHQLAQERKANLALRYQLQQSKKERDLLLQTNMELEECNATIRESHRTAMLEERDHLRREIKRRKVAEGRLSKAKCR